MKSNLESAALDAHPTWLSRASGAHVFISAQIEGEPRIQVKRRRAQPLLGATKEQAGVQK
jgi:hypothetical protein